MKCLICKSGQTQAGYTTLTFEKDGCTFVVKDVPADVCDNCGEAYISEENSRKVFETINKEMKKGVEIEILHFAA